MKFVVKLFPEITIKTRPVRKLLTKQLAANIRNVLHRVGSGIQVKNGWDAVEVYTPEHATDALNDDVYEALTCIPGIAAVNRVREFELGSFDDIVQNTLSVWRDALVDKTFVVRVKRTGKHDFQSTDVERYVGGGIRQHSDAKGVDLHNPDVLIRLEVREQKLMVIDQRRAGLGGFPIGGADSTVSLVSGGFDSTVASYQMMRRGIRTHFLFFNLGGAAHENGVKEVIYYLWKKYGSSHKVKFISVPFEGVVEEILEQVEDRYMGVVLKRMMVRAANAVAQKLKVDSFVTGEALSQVSSQTMMNLRLIDEVSDRLVIRPLAVSDKQTIVDAAREIGAASFVERIPEYCGVISKKPNAACKRDDVVRAEQPFAMCVLDQALQSAKVELIDEMVWQPTLEMEQALNDKIDRQQAVIIDVRHPNEIEQAPLEVAGQDIIQMPFYSLNRQFKTLDQQREYLLYCDKGVMSKMHALHLADNGFKNVGVFRLAE
ncbi:tRNA uracil 4-sulfurtransferase ThiI [Reinekea thalattae]|uniref:tRNA sulfurtransferase n=1 Tax=Reinekea thalattae TaxID=2593301 RepID=A0A5C8ZAD4_9GAMM|nr:tRNA uracil 4-sulfurtransferase ThiI [Reinekea thalattae]TXR54143.1 tRNA 4-thiouridine(8) synthase ThiI [Reinekea thalattae]